ncbi:MAG: hypothetical protein ACI4S9_06865, partial [Christensenellales bacterium]
MIKLFDIDIETQTTLTMRHLDCKAEDLTVVCKGEGVKYQWCRESRGGTLLLRFTHTGKFRCEVYSGGKTASCEMSSRKLVYDAEKGGFPVLEGVEFEDGIFKTVKPELENSAGSGCSFLLKNDRSAKVSVVSEGELARVTKTEAHYVCPGLPCDEKSFAEYYWYDTGDMIFVNAYISAPEDEYLINFLKLRLKNAKTFSGSYPKIDGDIDGKRILGFDGSAV